MDPFSSFDLFRRRVDSMFADFDQQMFGASSEFGFDSPFLTQQQQQQQQQQRQGQQQQSIGHEKPTSLSSPAKEEERIIPHSNNKSSSSDRSLSTRPSSSSSLGLWSWPLSSSLPSLKLDVSEDNNNYIVTADCPGFSKEEMKLEVKDGVLHVSGEKNTEREDKDEEKKYHRIERSSGSVYRAIRLPDGVKEDDISASCENGVLKVVLPKDELRDKKKERSIAIH